MRRRFLAVAGFLALALGEAAPGWAQSMGATTIVQGGNTATVNASGQLLINCGNCTGSGASLADEAAFAEGTTAFAPIGGEYNASPTALASGHAGVAEMTSTRHVMVDVADALPAGSNTIGTVNAAESGSWTVGLNAGSNTIGAVTQASGPWSVNLTQMAGTALAANPCWTAIPTEANINLTASGQIIAGVASKQTYVCSLSVVANGADNIALVEGTGTTCGTGTAGMAGGTTAATGWNFAANGGLTHGAGIGPVYRTATVADNVCVLASGTAQVSGSAMYVQM